MKKPRMIFGIDFSGAQDAGKKTWITTGVSVADGLVVEACLQARDLPSSGKRLEACMTALVELVKSNCGLRIRFSIWISTPLDKGKNMDRVDLVVPFPVQRSG